MNFINGTFKKNILLLKAKKTLILKLTKAQTTLLNKYVKEKVVNVNKEYEDDRVRFSNTHQDCLNNVDNIVLGIRPEDIYLDKKYQVETLSEPLNIDCDLSELLGHELIVYGYLGKQKIIINTSALNDIKPHTSNQFSFDTTKMYFFDKDSTNRIK